MISIDEKFLYKMSKEDVFVPQQKQVSLPPTNNSNAGASSDDTMHYGPMKHLIIKDEK